jgi:iron-sulfur cluster repair protein YtfE (RIC family)
MVQSEFVSVRVRAFFRRIRSDHERLFDLLGSVEGDISLGFSAMASDGARSRARAEVLELLGELEIRLTEHFAHEEQAGFLENALQAAPRLSRRAGHLKGAHEKLSSLLNRLTERAERAAVDDDEAWRAIAAQFESFRERLRDHEHEEDELIQQALLDDLGGG